VVFLTTHSTPGEGLIHTMPGGEGASDVTQVLGRLIPSSLQEVVRSARMSMLFILACGAVNSASKTEVASYIKK
jgi:hypothetical protein